MRRLSLPLLVVMFAGPAHAQRIEVPDVIVGEPAQTGSQLTAPDAASGLDGTMLFAWRDRRLGHDERYVYGHRFSAAGLPLAAALRLDDSADATDPHLAASLGGGYLGTWRRVQTPRGIDIRRLDQSGVPVAASAAVSTDSVNRHAIAALPSGTVSAWFSGGTLKARLFDTDDLARGPAFTVAAGASSESLSVARTSDGGFVVVWVDDGASWGRRYDGDGIALGAAVLLSDVFTVKDVAASPLGGFVIVGSHTSDSHAQPSGVWGRRFDGTGAPNGSPFLIYAKPPTAPPLPQAEFDALGNLYVAWADTGGDREPIHARAFDAGGRALGPAFRVTLDVSSALATAVRPDGRMVNAWSDDNMMHANVLALCTPPYHTGCGDGVSTLPCERCDQGAGNSGTLPDACRTTCQLASCGDGVIDAGEECDDGNGFGCDGCDTACKLEPGYVCGDGVTFPACGEECDDGPANSDTTADACRTSCRLPSCGDDVVDSGEPCDDGNLESCDGCSAVCVPEPGLICGDGIAELACDEQCDDGNAVVGDGCVDSCRLERIPGGGTPRTECLVEWSINNPSNLPLYDKHGAVNGVQSCVDGDPRCDFDGAVSGSCTFALEVCANDTDVEGCTPPTRLASWELTSPSIKKADRDPAMAAVRAAFASVTGSIVGPTMRDVCSATVDVVVPLQKGIKTGKLTLKARASDYDNVKDTDKLKLNCLPAGG